MLKWIFLFFVGTKPIKAKQLTKTESDLNYSCKIETASEAEIIGAVQSINYSIDNLVSNILEGVKEFNLSYRKPSLEEDQNRCDIPTNPELDIPLLQSLLINPPSLLSDDTRDNVVKTILRNLFCLLVHKHFFKGGHFFGVGSETHREYLETMFSKLVADGKFSSFFKISP